MVAFFNSLGGLMMVPESRVEEYKALGYREMAPATPEPIQKAEEKKEQPKAEKPKEQPKVEKPKAKATTTKKSVSKSKK